MKEKLFKLDTFCQANEIEYTLTGTMALQLLGLPGREPQDLDILVHHATETQILKLKELQFLSGLNSAVYENNESFSFILDGIKINAIIDNTESYDTICSRSISVMLIDEKSAKRHFIEVHSIFQVLKAKMRLRRPKDAAYMLNLIHSLTSL